MKLNKKIKKEIKDHAFEERPKECCGLLILLSNQSIEAHRCRNEETKDDKFKINPEDYLTASQKGKIMGVYHSHTNDLESFSQKDKYFSKLHGLKYVLYNTRFNSFFQYDPDSDPEGYVGRVFEIGKQDCFGLMKEFYKEELNIDLKNYNRDSSWEEAKESLFDKHFEKEGFVKVDDLKKYDCILFKFKKKIFSDHIAIYMGDNKILHHPINGFSKIDFYGEQYKRLTNYTIRHKSLL